MRRKKLLFLLTATSIFLVTIFLFLRKVAKGGFEKELIPSFTEIQSTWSDIHGLYLSTMWKQDDEYTSFTPGNALLGCWSVAFAQVLAFQKLSPSGEESYTTSNGETINQVFNDPVKWEKIINSVDTGALPEYSQETAKYCFQVATVLQKDFGTGEYRDIAIVPAEVSKHYSCSVIKENSDLVSKIRSEIHLGRPVIAYFNDILAIKIGRNGHAAVLDGIADSNNKLYVHLNCGWGGKGDGWFEYESLAKQRKLQYIFTVIPDK